MVAGKVSLAVRVDNGKMKFAGTVSRYYGYDYDRLRLAMVVEDSETARPHGARSAALEGLMRLQLRSIV